jgi:hypothetical protein
MSDIRYNAASGMKKNRRSRTAMIAQIAVKAQLHGMTRLFRMFAK